MTQLVELPEDAYPATLQINLSGGGEYSFETAKAMMWLSQLAYETEPGKIERILQRWHLVQAATLQSTANSLAATRGLVVSGWGATIAVFAGTDPLILRNWLTDISAVRINDIHAGFQKAMVSVLPQLRQAVDQRADDAQPLLFTGHSLGGALAVLAANELKGSGATAIYTFGMPRCGGDRFMLEYGALQQHTYRFVQGDDIVPNLPTPELGYRHVGRLMRCNYGGSFDPTAQPDPVGSNDPIFTQTVLSSARNRLDQLVTRELPQASQPGFLGQVLRFLPTTIGDHIPSRYLRALGFSL